MQYIFQNGNYTSQLSNRLNFMYIKKIDYLQYSIFGWWKVNSMAKRYLTLGFK